MLVAGELRVELLPAAGGGIARFDRFSGARRQPLFRGSDVDNDDALSTGCFPLVPFANRIRDGRFICDGRTVQLTPNLVGDISPLHGQGWRAAWGVVETGPRHAILRYRHDEGEWPWTYEAEQLIDLDERGLTLTLSCVNFSVERMPCGLGYHPYYPCDALTVLDTRVERAWTVDDAVLPVKAVPAIARYNLRERRIGGQSLDNGFDGWSGEATVHWPNEAVGLRVSSSDAGRFQVYSPPEGGFFAAEPVQNSNTALNAPQGAWPELGINLLPEGEKSKMTARFALISN